MNFYLDVLRESTLVSAPIPFSGNPTYFAMLGFGGYNMLLATAIAILGVVVGASISFYIGRFLLKLYRKQMAEANSSNEGYDKAARYFRRFFMPLLLVTWLPLFNFLPLIAGFLGQRFRVVMGLVLIGQIAYYGYFLFR